MKEEIRTLQDWSLIHFDMIPITIKQLKQITMHELAIELMEKLDNKYNMNNMLSLDEYLCEYYNVLSNNEINTITELLQM